MHSWIFRNRRRLELVYGLAPEARRPVLPPLVRPAGSPRRGRPRDLVLVPQPRRAS